MDSADGLFEYVTATLKYSIRTEKKTSWLMLSQECQTSHHRTEKDYNDVLISLITSETPKNSNQSAQGIDEQDKNEDV